MFLLDIGQKLRGSSGSFLKAPFFGHAKGVIVADSITDVIFDEELKFPAGHLFNQSSDGPNVKKTIWKKMNEVLEDKQMGPLIPFIPCSLHAVHSSLGKDLVVMVMKLGN